MRKWLSVFTVAFGLNWIWENLHSSLYAHFQGGVISPAILIYAAVVDAVIILFSIWLFKKLPKKWHRPWLLIVSGILVAVFIEHRAFALDRWAYNDFMPLIPVVNTGLTPTIQLGLLGYLTYFIVFHILQPNKAARVVDEKIIH